MAFPIPSALRPLARRLKRRLFGRRSTTMFHAGNRAVQDRFDSRKLADRLVEELSRAKFTDSDREFIESAAFFFLATADGQGRPDCSFRGGPFGFVRVAAPDALVFPDYDGNGMFKSLGNILVNPHVGMLFLKTGPTPARLRVNGRAEMITDDPMIADIPGAQMLIRVTPTDIFPNCPRYIPHLEFLEHSSYTPQAGVPPVEPEWKELMVLKDVVPPRSR